jgi:hypothetical protein
MYPTRFWHVIWRDANPKAPRFKHNPHKMKIYAVNSWCLYVYYFPVLSSVRHFFYLYEEPLVPVKFFLKELFQFWFDT